MNWWRNTGIKGIITRFINQDHTRHHAGIHTACAMDNLIERLKK
jgi:hypothetical protein